MPITFTVDRSLCQGHGRCAALLPDVFDLDDNGFAVLVGSGSVPDKDSATATDVVASCPEGAIRAER